MSDFLNYCDFVQRLPQKLQGSKSGAADSNTSILRKNEVGTWEFWGQVHSVPYSSIALYFPSFGLFGRVSLSFKGDDDAKKRTSIYSGTEGRDANSIYWRYAHWCSYANKLSVPWVLVKYLLFTTCLLEVYPAMGSRSKGERQGSGPSFLFPCKCSNPMAYFYRHLLFSS